MATTHNPLPAEYIRRLKVAKQEVELAKMRLRRAMQERMIVGYPGGARDTPELYAMYRERRTNAAAVTAFIKRMNAPGEFTKPIRMPESWRWLQENFSRHLRQTVLGMQPRLAHHYGTCPVCRSATIAPAWEMTSTPCTVCLDAGAIYCEDQWWVNTEAMQAALSPSMVWLLEGDSLQRRSVLKNRLDRYKTVVTDENMPVTRDGEPVHYALNTLRLNYHSGAGNIQYDAERLRVGIELEVNAGTHNSMSMENVVGRILLATNHAVKVERDGSVTGFEVISGHGSPAALRDRLSPIFSNNLLKGFRTGTGTGAHVHVTSPWAGAPTSAVKAAMTQSMAHLWSVYEKLAGRAYNGYARRGCSEVRYSSVALRGETVEFRLFRMQLSLAKLMRNAQFAWATVGHENSVPEEDGPAPDRDAFMRSWLEWISDMPREHTLELRAWLAAEGHKVPHAPTEYRKFYRDLGVSSLVS